MANTASVSEPLVSVIIPCYNDSEWVGDAVRSVLDQSYEHVELIVVDDGSEDVSPEVVQSIIDRGADNVRLFRKENGGPSSARNRGVDAARGDYFLFLDADDLLLPTAVEKHIETMHQRDADATIADWINFDEETGEEEVVSAAFRFPEDPLASLLYQPMPTSAAVVQSTERRWDESMIVGEIFEYFFGVFINGVNISYVGEAGSRIRHGHDDERLTEAYDHWEASGRIELFSQYKQDLKSLGRLSNLREAVIDYKQLSRLYAGMRRGDDVKTALDRIDISRSKLPSYYWFNLFGLGGFAYLFGVRGGSRLFYQINFVLGRA